MNQAHHRFIVFLHSFSRMQQSDLQISICYSAVIVVVITAVAVKLCSLCLRLLFNLFGHQTRGTCFFAKTCGRILTKFITTFMRGLRKTVLCIWSENADSLGSGLAKFCG